MRLVLFFTLLIGNFTYGQSSCKVIIKVRTKSSKSPVENASVKLFDNDSLICSHKTDSSGKVSLFFNADAAKTYSVHLKSDSHYAGSPVMFIPEIENGSFRVVYLEIFFLPVCKLALPTLPQFNGDETQKFSNFERSYFRDLFDEYENIRVDIFYSPRKEEKRKLKRLRKKVFKKELKNMGVRMNRINFSNKQPNWHTGCEGCFYSTVSSWGN